MDTFDYEILRVINKIKKWALISIVINALILALIIYIRINE